MATDAERLAEAKAAYHALMTGSSVVETRDANGELVRYTAINRVALARYIEELENLVNGTTTAPLRPFIL